MRGHTKNHYLCPHCGHEGKIEVDLSCIEGDGYRKLIDCEKCDCEITVIVHVEYTYEQDGDDYAKAWLRARGYMGPIKPGVDYYVMRFVEGRREKNENYQFFDEAYELVKNHYDRPVEPPWQCRRCGKKKYGWELKCGRPDYPVCERCEDQLADVAAKKFTGDK